MLQAYLLLTLLLTSELAFRLTPYSCVPRAWVEAGRLRGASSDSVSLLSEGSLPLSLVGVFVFRAEGLFSTSPFFLFGLVASSGPPLDFLESSSNTIPEVIGLTISPAHFHGHRGFSRPYGFSRFSRLQALLKLQLELLSLRYLSRTVSNKRRLQRKRSQ